MVMVQLCPDNKIDKRRQSDKTAMDIYQVPAHFKELTLKSLFLCRFGGSSRQVSQFWWVRDPSSRHLKGLKLICNALGEWSRKKQRTINVRFKVLYLISELTF